MKEKKRGNMRIGIICAGDSELEPFLKKLPDHIIEERAMLKFYCTTYKNIDLIMLYSGVCKVNAAIAAQILIDRFNVDILINSGVAGGVDRRLKLFDTVVATHSIYHDVAEDILTEFHPWLKSNYFQSDSFLIEKLREVEKESGKNIYFGVMVTGEKFIVQEHRTEIIEKYNPLCVDMETAAIAHTCYVNRIPFVSVRTITDTEENSGIDTFEENCEKASNIAKDIVFNLLDKIV